MYFILIDWEKKNDYFLEKEFKRKNIEYRTFDIPNYSTRDNISKFGSIKLYWKYLQLAYRAIFNSSKEDTLICWNFTTAIASGVICRIFRKKRRILALNIIAPPRNKFIEPIRNRLFHQVMKTPAFQITVNSAEYIESYSKRFNISTNKFFVLNDTVPTEDSQRQFISSKSFVFVGGEAKRDWKTLFKASNLLPAISFVCIARKKYFDDDLVIPANVKLLFDIDQQTFYDLMDQSTIVTIPLNTQLPAGLIILLKAAIMLKPIVATSTPSTRNYIENNKSGFLIEQANEVQLAEKIELLYNNISLQQNFSNQLRETVLKEHSTEKYTDKLISILNN